MEKLDKIIEIDESIFQTFQNFMERYDGISKSFPFPKTLTAFLNFISNTNFIKEGIVELAQSDNTFSLNILFRSLIEQFLKFQYIWMKFLEDKSDSIGDDYWNYYSYSEDVDYAKAWTKVYAILDHIPEKDPIEVIKEANPNFGSLSNSLLKQKVSQFNYRNVAEFIDVRKLNKSEIAIGSL